MIIPFKEIQKGQEPPLWYGASWVDESNYTVVYLPIPFNFIIGWAREIWLRLRYGPARMTQLLAAEYREGYDAGFSAGRQSALFTLHKVYHTGREHEQAWIQLSFYRQFGAWIGDDKPSRPTYH